MAAVSASMSSTLSLYSPNTFSPSSSSSSSSSSRRSPQHLLSLRHLTTSNHKFVINLAKPSSRKVFAPFSPSNIYNINRNSRVSAHQTESEAGLNEYPSLKSLIQAYKGAILEGDGKTMHEVEDIILMIEKEKTELAQKVSAFSEEISSGKEKFVRLQADFDNYRKRYEKDRLKVRSDAQGEVIESLLPMVDSFERAKQQIMLETEREKKIDTSYQGIYKQFVEIMRSLRVSVVPTVGKPFDPSMHEAIAREESHEFKEGIIIEEFRRGFYLGERLLRPAMVKVSSGPGKKKPPSSVPDQSSEQPASIA